MGNAGQGQPALDMFARMRAEGLAPNSVTLVFALKACLVMKGWARVKHIHNMAVENGCISNVYVQSTLVDAYAKCGSMVDAYEVFDGVKHPDVVSWNVLILGYVTNGRGQTAWDLFTTMKNKGPTPNSVTLLAAIKACCTLVAVKEEWAKCREKAKEIHNDVVAIGCSSDVYVQSALVDMYAKCGSMVEACDVFDSMMHPTVVSWTALILGYANNDEGRTALDMFTRMRGDCVPDSITFVAALKACISLAEKEEPSQWVETGKILHSIVVEYGCNSDVYVQSILIDMYVKCGSMIIARELFHSMKHPDVVLWTVLISGYADNGEPHTALDMFTRMRTEGSAPNYVTLGAALKACISFAIKEGSNRWADCKVLGEVIHNFAVEDGCHSSLYIGSTLVDMYAKCGSMVDSRAVFDSMQNPDLVSWTALISGYSENGQCRTALDMFTIMRAKGPAPDFVTFAAALKACGVAGALDYGRTIHSEIDDIDVVLLNCLVDFYVKCGSLVEAKAVFDLHPETRDLITWSALLAGFSSCGDHEVVFGLFRKMQDEGFKPVGINFLCILTCCSHAGLVVKGKECFDTMSTKYGVIPTLKHYTCMIDLFGRANRLDDAVALINCMPCNPDEVTWMTILSACHKWKNVEIGKLAFQSLIDLNDNDVAAYLLMSQIYGSRGMVQEQRMVMGLKSRRGSMDGSEDPQEL